MKSYFIIVVVIFTITIGCQKEESINDSFNKTVKPEDQGWSGDSLPFALSNAEQYQM